jgi:hypothetical protein
VPLTGVGATDQWLHNLAEDISWDIHDAIAEGGLVAVHATVRGHQSDLHMLSDPDGQPVQ